ncbi:MAG: hypothetical protein LC722_02030 [Actinobacteria bacterium]|nr:hypothetical protein [Actinomycetota bacterium]
MKTWFTGCEKCGTLTARVAGLCLVCELEREAAMAAHPSAFARIRRAPKPRLRTQRRISVA